MSPDGEVVSSTPGAFRLRWDVFLSFRGADTRRCFTKPLFNALQSRDVRVFLDDVGLDRGDQIAPSLLEAIDDSAASIIIFSPRYASSHWCLEELAKIWDCGRLILPVFFNVDPSHVRKQEGPFRKYFKKHEAKRSKEEVSRWREAMKKIGGIAGFPFRHPSGNKEDLIQLIVTRILRELSNAPVGVAEFTVGLDARIEELLELLDMRSNGIRVLGLYGMGGVGKTTLAKALFNRLVVHFEHRSFISSVREVSSKDGGLISLRNRIISDISSQVVVGDNIPAFRRIVDEYPGLIILDDVDDVKQLDTLIVKREWFHKGSRIVVTSRNTQALPERHVNVLYEVHVLGESESLELFSYHAMRRNEPADKNLLKLSKEIVSLTGRLPLALEVFGSMLFGKRREKEWVDAVEKLKQTRPGNLQEVLKISYEGLDEQEKSIFLDIACLFVQMSMKREDVIDILRGCGFRGEIAITDLTEKCLIKIREDETIWMHDQIRDMGRQIVVDENLVDPGMRSRLWDRSEILAVLRNFKGTRSIQGMVLDLEERSTKDHKDEVISGKHLQWGLSFANARAFLKQLNKKYFQRVEIDGEAVVLQTKSFETMVNLVLLQINNVRLEGKFKSFPPELKWLQWKGCPLKFMPSDFLLRELAVLDLSRGKIENLWNRGGYKVPENMMVMNMSHCYNLETLPDLSGCRRLEKIVLENCFNLRRIHESISNLTTLRHLNLTLCRELAELPKDVSGLKNLETLCLSYCFKLKSLPENLTNLKSLKKLLADRTALAELPETIFHLEKLEILILNGCQNLKRLPDNIGLLCSLQELSLDQSGLEELPNSVGRLKNLEKLSLMHCESLTRIPDSIGNLVSLSKLWLFGSAIGELPSSVGSLSYLKELSVGNCKFLNKLPESIKSMVSIVELQLDGAVITDLPGEIGNMTLLKKLEMRNCQMRYLPKSVGNLTALTTWNIFNGNIVELPESIGKLENLVHLRLDRCRMLRRLPNSIGHLKSLYHLRMEETGLTELPESFGELTSLRTLKMAKKSEDNLLQDSTEISSFFCKMIFLNDLDARGWKISGSIPDDFEKLSCLETLNLSQNKFHSLPSSLAGLSVLRELFLQNCTEPVSLPALPSSLTKLDAANCCSLQSIHDLSNLKSLKDLNLANCIKLVDIPGLERLESLKWLYLGGCIACSSTIRKRFSKVTLRNLINLSMPGTRLPKWFSGQTVSFSKPKNRELTGVIIGVILSINHDIPEARDLPGVVDIKLDVLKLGKNICTTGLDLRGLPTTNEEHIHLCRFPDYHHLMPFLRDGDTFSVTRLNPPMNKGLELKKCGFHLIFEGDDDYSGDEETLDRSLQSVSEKLAEFFNTCEEGSSEDGIESEDDECQEQLETQEMREEKISSSIPSKSNVLYYIIRLFLFLLILLLIRFAFGYDVRRAFRI
ncbi:disease resistance protein RUN1-like [Prosopis cineraria]|uniref:disease resistance protein RUN1-like n=1 Tax=Prosopis cineraria TaxID=364024 RepID=UPI00240F94B3|nr:disease resistance protein RUN1-like [Prosopis cineraria]